MTLYNEKDYVPNLLFGVTPVEGRSHKKPQLTDNFEAALTKKSTIEFLFSFFFNINLY